MCTVWHPGGSGTLQHCRLHEDVIEMTQRRAKRKEPEIVLEQGDDYRIILVPQIHGIEPPTAEEQQKLRQIQRADVRWAKKFRKQIG